MILNFWCSEMNLKILEIFHLSYTETIYFNDISKNYKLKMRFMQLVV